MSGVSIYISDICYFPSCTGKTPEFSAVNITVISRKIDVITENDKIIRIGTKRIIIIYICKLPEGAHGFHRTGIN